MQLYWFLTRHFKSLYTLSIHIGEVSENIGIKYGYVKQIEVLVYHNLYPCLLY